MKDDMIELGLEKFNTPFYLYDASIIRRQANTLRKVLFPNARMFYSIKANPLIGICKVLIAQGYGIEVASKGELLLALKSGCLPPNIIFTGPGKEYDEIYAAVEENIFCINIENIREIEMINSIACDTGKRMRIAIRINLGKKSNAKISMSGNTQFGIPLENIDEAIGVAQQCKMIDLIGFQVYSGTEILDEKEIIRNSEEIILNAIALAEKYQINLKYLNLGGGFGVPYFANDKALDIDLLYEGMQELYKKYPLLEKIENVIFESGRFLMAESGVFVTKVLYEKRINDTKFLICDGGSNFHSASAFLGRFVRNNFPIHSMSKSKVKESVTIVGKLCTPSDVIGQNVEINQTSAEMCIVIEKSGAYGLTYSPYGFLGHKMPFEIMYDNGEFFVLRGDGGRDTLDT